MLKIQIFTLFSSWRNTFEISVSRIKMGVVFLQAFCHLDDEICNKQPWNQSQPKNKQEILPNLSIETIFQNSMLHNHYPIQHSKDDEKFKYSKKAMGSFSFLSKTKCTYFFKDFHVPKCHQNASLHSQNSIIEEMF